MKKQHILTSVIENNTTVMQQAYALAITHSAVYWIA
jgi:hypothetical protein